MAKTLRIAALAVALLAVSIWLATGAHRGWTKTSVATIKVDEITGIEQPVYEKRFVAGVDFLGAALLGSAALSGLAYFFKQNKTNK